MGKTSLDIPSLPPTTPSTTPTDTVGSNGLTSGFLFLAYSPEPELEADPTLPPPKVLQGYVNATVPGPGGEAGEALQDPINGDATIIVPGQANAAGGGSAGNVATKSFRISCYEFTHYDLICGSTRYNYFFGGNFRAVRGPCVHEGADGPTGAMGPGMNNTNCASVYTGPTGVHCVPTCEGGGSSGSKPIPTGPVSSPIPAPTAGAQGGNPNPNNSAGGSAPLTDEPLLDTGISNTNGVPGGSNTKTLKGKVAVFGGGGGGGGPALMDYPSNNTTVKRKFTIKVSDGQSATAELDSGDFVRVITNPDGTVIVGKVTKFQGKTTFIEIQRILPGGTPELEKQLNTLSGQVTQLQAGITQLQAQISEISESPSNTGDPELEDTIYYPVPNQTFPAEISKEQDPEIPPPPRNDPRPRKKPKDRDPQSSSSTSTPASGGSGGVSGTATQVVIIQDDSSQSFVRIR